MVIPGLPGAPPRHAAGWEGSIVSAGPDEGGASADSVVWLGRYPPLVWDPAGKGEVVDGSQLFGTHSFGKQWKHGYEALANLDRERDGKLSGQELDAVSVWLDRNQDAVAQPGEVVRATAFGVEEVFVQPDAEQKELAKGYLWATRGFTRTVQGKRETLPTVDWFTPADGAAEQIASLRSSTSPLTEEVVSPEEEPAEGEAQVASARAPAAEAVAKQTVSAITKDTPYELWRWAVGGDASRAPANQGGWLSFQRGEQGQVVVTSVVVAPLKESDAPVCYAALTTVMKGVEKVQGDGTKVIHFKGRKADQDDRNSGVEIATKAFISADGKSMRGETAQTPFGKGKARRVSYAWDAVSLGRSDDVRQKEG